ncbi:hypothetical protein FQZ97_1246530 [compost metagenome]
MAVAGALFDQALVHQTGQHAVHRGFVLVAGGGQVGESPAELRPGGDHAHEFDAAAQALGAGAVGAGGRLLQRKKCKVHGAGIV